jgi:hypothetical protein
VNGLAQRLPPASENEPVRKAAADLDKKLLSVRDELLDKRITANEDSLAYPARIDIRLAGLAMGVSLDTDSAPTEPSYKQFDQMKKLLDEQVSGWTTLQGTDLAAFQKMAAERGITPVVLAPPDRARQMQEREVR